MSIIADFIECVNHVIFGFQSRQVTCGSVFALQIGRLNLDKANETKNFMTELSIEKIGSKES
jgi:hypothetical protein